MAKSYTTTINVKCWKEHTCISCGAVHAYLFERKVTGKASNAEASRRRAQANVTKTLNTQVDLHPCPACGIYQPDMISQQRVRWHRATFWVALIFFGIMLIFRGTDILQANIATWIIAGAGTLAVLQMFGKELKNFNANPEGNRALAANTIAAGKLVQTAGAPSAAAPQWVKIGRSPAQTLCAPLLLLGVLLLAAAELFRAMHGWPLNEVAYPPVVGPGDQTRIYMPHKIESLNGYWRGTAKATLTEPGPGKDPISMTATTNQNDWGSTINVKSEDQRNSSTPWVEIRLPPDSSLAGKTVSCDLQLDIEYPQMSGTEKFKTQLKIMSHQLSLNLAAVGAGAMYDQLWWGGGVAGMVVILGMNVALILSAQGLRKKANPTRILNPATGT